MGVKFYKRDFVIFFQVDSKMSQIVINIIIDVW